jgi:hypothetical protein
VALAAVGRARSAELTRTLADVAQRDTDRSRSQAGTAREPAVAAPVVSPHSHAQPTIAGLPATMARAGTSR